MNAKKKIVDTTYRCPECGYPQFCPCKACANLIPDGYKPWVWHLDREVISCADCGLTQHVDRWTKNEQEYYKDKQFKCKHIED